MTQDSNASVTTLSVLGAVSGAAGAIMMVVGLAGDDTEQGYRTVKQVNGGLVGAGGALLGLALMIWVLLLLFWAWRTERRFVPAYTPPVASTPSNTGSASAAAAQSVGANRVQRDAAEKKLTWADDGS